MSGLLSAKMHKVVFPQSMNKTLILLLLDHVKNDQFYAVDNFTIY